MKRTSVRDDALVYASGGEAPRAVWPQEPDAEAGEQASLRGARPANLSRLLAQRGTATSLVVAATAVSKVRAQWNQGLRGLFAVHPASDWVALKRSILELRPSTALVDLALPELGGVKGVRSIVQMSPSTKSVVLSADPDDREAVSFLRAGARGYCARDIDPFLLRKALEVVQKGEIWVRRNIISVLLNDPLALRNARDADEVNDDERLACLTPRERQIAHLIGRGACNKEIATWLNITETTVKAHLTAIFRKLGISDRLRLALFVTEPNRAGH